MFKDNKNFEIIDIKKEFSKYTITKFLLTNKEISYIKTNIYGKFRGLSLKQCLNKLPKDNFNLQILIKEIKYNVSVNNNKNEKEREEKL